MSSNPESSERRRFHRILFDAPATITAEGREFDTRLVDISLKGALAAVPEDWPGEIGMDARILIRLDEGDDVIEMTAQIMHQEGDRIGLQCRHIDMDSITHLRRLVELNLGDANLLERELAQLG